MSITKNLDTKLTNPKILEKTCKQLKYMFSKDATYTFYDGKTVTGIMIEVPSSSYPIMVDSEGELFHDNMPQRVLNNIVQNYAVTGILTNAHNLGFMSNVQKCKNGSIEVEVFVK